MKKQTCGNGRSVVRVIELGVEKLEEIRGGVAPAAITVMEKYDATAKGIVMEPRR
jgi:hypothetical protein